MIKELIVRNFKCHQDTNIKLGNLTVLTGTNSSGKSSLIQALLLLRQSYQKGRLMDGLDFNDPLCKIGTVYDALCRFSGDSGLSFSITNEEGESFSFAFEADVANLKHTFIKKKLYSANIDNAKLDSLSLFNDEFQYISVSRWGGISKFPKDSFVASLKQISFLYGRGEFVAQYLSEFGFEDVSDYTEGGEDDLSLINQAIYWEQKISPNITFRIEERTEDNAYLIFYDYKGVDGEKDIKDLSAANVGYGISYTLPVIVALLSARRGALIVIENPEAHLHPAGQSQLAKLITMVARNGVQVIIETHSDHIISGIQLACKENTKDKTKGINKEDVVIHFFCNNGGQASEGREVNIKEDGTLEYQPKGFFDQSEMDMFQLYE